MTKIDVLYDESNKIELTVALPVYNSKKIAWVCLEGLCNQIDIDFEWELVIYEEYHNESCFPTILFDYIHRLKEVNCKKITFLTNNVKTPLITKWLEIAKNSSDFSIAYLLQPADCYSHKKRLKVTYDKIVKEGYDWYDQKTGNFYSLLSDRIITYDYNALTNLCIATLTKAMRTLPNSTQTSGIDGYTYKYVSSKIGSNFKRFLDQNIYEDGLDIHGLNNISLKREEYFDTRVEIFKKPNLKLFDLGKIPKHILDKIYSLKKNINNNYYNLSILISTYENIEYLKDCFDSIIKSIGDNNVEVLVGVDSCLKTKEYVMKNYFPDNFRFYFFEKNVGPYTVFNTLSEISNSDKIMFFGSDDIMGETMVSDMIDGLSHTDCVRSSYVNFKNGDNINNLKNKKESEGGVFAIKKDIFNKLNGFEPWMCEADTEFMIRIFKNRVKLKVSNKIDFYRRIHSNGLTSRPDTGMNSKLRSEYRKIYKNKKDFDPLPKKVTESYLVLKEGLHQKKENIVETKQKSVNPLGGLFNRPKIEEPKVINYEKVNEVTQNRQTQKPERPQKNYENKNSNSDMAKNVIISKKPVKPNGGTPLMKIGKDFLRI